MIIVAIIVVIILVYILAKYNQLVKQKNIVKQSQASIDVYLNQRFDLIPNLVECVKSYTKHEKETLENIAKMRKEYVNGDKSIKKAEEIGSKMNKIIAIAEQYPELKASEQYTNLQDSLRKTENQLQAARRSYNIDATNYNTTISTIPTNLVAKMFGFREVELFQIEDYKKENIDISKGLNG